MAAVDITFNEDLPSLNGLQLQKLVAVFLEAQRKRNQATTVKGYRFKLQPFIDWWREIGPEREWVLSADDLLEYPRYLERLGWEWGTRHDALRRLRQMFHWAHKMGYVPLDFAVFVPKMKGGAPVKSPVALEVLQKLLKAAWQTENNLRNRAIIAILAGTGLRREECASLQVENITWLDSGAGYLRPPVTKNDKPRIVAFDADTGTYLRQWLEVFGAEEGPLWPSRKGGGSLSVDGIYKVVMDCAKIAGVDVETHDLRRMFATTWSKKLRGEGYGKLLQVQMGHVSYSTTALYNLQGADDVLAVMSADPVSPIAQLSKKKAAKT